MVTVTLDTVDYEVYEDIAFLDAYINASPSFESWENLDTEAKTRFAITATRIFDRQNWIGAKTDSAQDLAWPRTGIADVEDDVIPTDVLNAYAEICLFQALGTDVQTQQSVAQTVRRLAAGSVSLEFFRGAEGAALRFPLPIWELIGKYLGGGATFTNESTGTDGCSAFDKDFSRDPF